MNNENRKNDTLLRISFYIIVLIICFCIVFSKPILNNINITKAEKCFEAKNYVCAFNAYRNAFANGINNSQYLSNYVSTLSKIKKISLVQKELNNLLETYPSEPAAIDIEEIFAQLQKKISKEYHTNYIENVVQGTNIVHWNTQNDPVNVLISTKGEKVPDYYVKEVKNALTDYQKITNNNIRFYYTNKPEEANIEILFTKDISGGKCETNDDCAKVLGLTENNTSGYVLRKSTIRLRTKDTDDTEFTANQIHNIAKHEIGHALGIIGHSYYSDDVMYPVSNDAKWAENVQTLIIKKKEFSKRDIETINLLYKIVPDITNKSYDLKSNPDMYMPIAVLGTKKQIGEKKLEEATTYTDTVTNNFVAKMNLAETYFSNKNIEKAKETFESALQSAFTDKEKFTVYHNLAVIAYEENDYDKAISYSDMANSYGNENISDMNSNDIKAYSYLEKKDYNNAQKIMEKQITVNPENVPMSAALVGLYVKKYQLFKALDEIKRIKKVKPDAVKEPVYQPYKWLVSLT